MIVRKIAKLGFSITAIAYIIIHFLELTFSNNLLLGLLSIFGVLALFFAIVLLPIRAAMLPLFLIALAVFISLLNMEVKIYNVLWYGPREMRALLPMLFIIPFVGWVLKQENYVEDTIILLKSRLKNGKVFYFVLMFMTQIISFFLLFGSIAVVYQIVQSFLSKKNTHVWKAFKGTAILRGFSLTSIWIISIPSFAYSVEIIDAPLLKTFFQGFIMSILGLLVAVFFLHRFEKRQGVSFSKDIRKMIAEAARKMDDKDESIYRNPFEFAFLFLSLLGVILLVNSLAPIGLLTVIPIVVIVWVFVYFVVKGKLPTLFSEGKQYFSDGITYKVQEWGLLLSVGLLIVVLNSSGLSENMMQGLYHWTESSLGLNFLWILPFVVLSFGFIGMGPLSVMVLIGGIIQSIYLPYPPELIVLSMTLGSSMSVMLSPVIIPAIMLSSLNGWNTIKNSFRQNWKFAIAIYLMVEFYIQIRILLL